ncbi:MAG: dimethylamine monooxygenase subunit DmmA family protein [Hyphomicrobium sp.]
MLRSEVKSRPVYPGLEPDLYASSNIVVCDRAGAVAAAEMLAKADTEFASRTVVLLYAGEYAGTQALEAQIDGLKPARTIALPNLNAAVAALGERLFRSKMGTRVYAAGSEPLIGCVVQRAMRFAIDPLSVRTEHRGSLKRRVRCVHCRGTTEDVTVSPVKCAHCGLTLAVRDHYSRRLAAFMGVCVDAEVPGELPQQVEFQ